jgi:hypothetical protein
MSKFILNLPTQIIFLKSGYNIPLKDTANQSLQLLIELGDFGISLIWTDTQKKQIAALAVFIFEDEDDKVEQIRNTINRFVITGKEQKSLKIFYNFRESMLVPSKYYNEELNEQMLSLLFGENDDAVIVPTTCNSVDGVFVPIPIFPDELLLYKLLLLMDQ